MDLSQPELGRILGWADRQSLSLCELGKQKMPVAQQIILKMLVLSRVAGDTTVGSFAEMFAAKGIGPVEDFPSVDGVLDPGHQIIHFG